MSQYGFKNKDENRVMYGLDKPTGGFFWQETDAKGNILCNAYGILLTDLLSYLKNNYNGIIHVSDLVRDFFEEKEPTLQQILTAKQFGFENDIRKKLEDVRRDVKKCMNIYAIKI